MHCHSIVCLCSRGVYTRVGVSLQFTGSVLSEQELTCVVFVFTGVFMCFLSVVCVALVERPLRGVFIHCLVLVLPVTVHCMCHMSLFTGSVQSERGAYRCWCSEVSLCVRFRYDAS